MDWLGLIEAILPRGIRQLIALVFLFGLFVFPRPFDSLFWSLVHLEERQMTSLLERDIGGALHSVNHHCGSDVGVKCQR
jgi:hypothetical protein